MQKQRIVELLEAEAARRRAIGLLDGGEWLAAHREVAAALEEAAEIVGKGGERMRTVEQIKADIDFVKRDIAALQGLHASTIQALEDLEELYEELRRAEQAPRA